MISARIINPISSVGLGRPNGNFSAKSDPNTRRQIAPKIIPEKQIAFNMIVANCEGGV